jgi:hypothetical protein
MSEFTMSTIKSVIATVLLSTAAVVSFAQAPTAPKATTTAAPAVATAPAANASAPKHVKKTHAQKHAAKKAAKQAAKNDKAATPAAPASK